MTRLANLFALITDPHFGSHATPSSGGGVSALVVDDVVVVMATGLMLALLLMLWARYGRSGRHARSSAPASGAVFAGSGSRRRRRRAPLGRNPTRAETGGLPPIRVDDPAPPLP